MSIDSEILNLTNAEQEKKAYARSKYVIETFTHGLFVMEDTEEISELGVTQVDGFIVYSKLWQKDWALYNLATEVDNIDLYSIPELARCTHTSLPGTPSDWDTWESTYDDYEPFVDFVEPNPRCNQIFFCEVNCFCCDTKSCLTVECNHDIILLKYIGFYPERGRIDYPLDPPQGTVLLCPTGFGTDSHDEPQITEGTSIGSVKWCAEGTITEDRNEVAMNVLMQGETLTNPAFQCDNGWHLNLNSQKCPETECCNCNEIIPFAIIHSTHQMAFGTSQDLSIPDPPGGWLPGCEITWELSGGGTLSTTTGTETEYTAPASNPGCTNNATVTCRCSTGETDSISISIYGTGISGTAFELSLPYKLSCDCGTAPTNECTCHLLGIGCDGSTTYDFAKGKCIGQCTPPIYLSMGCEYKLCIPPGAYLPRGPKCDGWGSYTNVASCDRRTALMLSQGCCPDMTPWGF